MNYSSLPTIDQVNLEKYWSVVRQLEPEYYMIRVALEETGVNPMVLPKIIRSIFLLATGTGNGKIQIFMEKKTVKTVKGEETDYVEEIAIIDKSR